MDENDKPIGAPAMHNEAPAQDPAQAPQKSKKKLNWKAFGIGVIAVIIIEVLAVSMLQSGDPQIPIEPINSPTKTQPSPTINPTADWETYTSERLGLSFQHPSQYEIVSEKNNIYITKSPEEKTLVQQCGIDYDCYASNKVSIGIFITKLDKDGSEDISDFIKKYYSTNSLGSYEKITVNGKVTYQDKGYDSTGGTITGLIQFIDFDGYVLRLDTTTKDQANMDEYLQIRSTFKFTQQ